MEICLEDIEDSREVNSIDGNRSAIPKGRKQGIRHFILQYIDCEFIGPMNACQNHCENKCTNELLLGNDLKKILVQRTGEDNIQSVLIIDDVGHVTAINPPNTDTMFDATQWRIFTLNKDETLIDMKHTDSFSKIEFLVCKLPKLKTMP